MRTYLRIATLGSVMAVAWCTGQAAAADGEGLYVERACVYCHGEAGKAPVLPVYPKLAGQSKDYLIQQTLDIKTRKRTNGYTGMMQPAITNVSEEEIEAIAEYLAGEK